jgi:AraC-like DNA-binding protein
LPLLPVVDAILRGMLLALLLLLALVLARDRPRLAAARAGVLMSLGLCVQVIGATPLLEDRLAWAWQAPLVGVSVANAVLFWVFVQALFDDAFAWRPLHLLAWGGVFGLSVLNCVLGPSSTLALAPLSRGLQRAVPLVFALLAARAAAAHWRADLVEGRRRLRRFIVVAGSGYTLLMLGVRLGSPQGRLSALAASADVALLLAMIAVVASRLLRLTTTELFPAAAGPVVLALDPAAAGTPAASAADDGAAAPLPPPDEAEQRLAGALQRLMADEHAYRSEDLSLASLAARLATPEYRLRRLINQRLGHRNFNVFVNGFRLAEACAALADPAKADRPVLSIALDAGFQSIGPFNRAFKVHTGRTPTEFRREHRADS